MFLQSILTFECFSAVSAITHEFYTATGTFSLMRFHMFLRSSKLRKKNIFSNHIQLYSWFFNLCWLRYTRLWLLKSQRSQLYFPRIFSWYLSKWSSSKTFLKNLLSQILQMKFAWLKCWFRWVAISSFWPRAAARGQK